MENSKKEVLKMVSQVLLTSFLAWLTLSIRDSNTEIQAHAKAITQIESTQTEVIYRLDGDIQEIRESLKRIESEVAALRGRSIN